MTSLQERLQLKRIPLDTWNIREQLCLASAVVRSGDQNWMSVSRALKTVGDASRPADWYSQKSCAAQYGALLENVETPKRKKRNSEGAVETPQESILKKLTQERIVEIQKTVAEMNQQYEQLVSEINEVRNPATSEERLNALWAGIEMAKRAREKEAARRALWLKEREERRARAERTWRPPTSTPTTTPITNSTNAPSSPLLTSLLKSTPVVTTPQHMTHPANVVETVSPSSTAPTLSMLLEKNSASPAQESKHAAIEHIKSQLVQIEQRLKANTNSPSNVASVPAVPLPAVPALDIDDIEIKAEDVYAFRDIPLHIPPLNTMHKGNRLSDSKPLLKKEDAIVLETPTEDRSEPMEVDSVQELVEEPHTSVEAVTTDVEMATETSVIEQESHSTKSDDELKVALPEVKFPTPEIKVKEEIKSPELSAAEQDITKEIELEKKEAPVSADTEPDREQQESVAGESKDMSTVGVKPVQITEPADIPLPPSPIRDDSKIKTETAQDKQPPLPQDTEPQKQENTNEAEMGTEEEQLNKEMTTEQKELNIKNEAELQDSMPVQDIKEESTENLESQKGEKSEVEDTHMETDDDTPMELSREEDRDGKKKRDYSRKKKPDSRTRSGSESATEASAPNSPGARTAVPPSVPPDTPPVAVVPPPEPSISTPPTPATTAAADAADQERQHRLWKKSVLLVYTRLCAHKYASLFLRPISDDEAPNYSVVVRRPMDLTTIKRNIEAGVIRTTAEFQRDVLLMLSNALMYNSSEHSVYRMAKEMHEEAQCQLGMLLAAQAHAGLRDTLRRRRPAATSSASTSRS